jgi:RNA polymerase sigma factor (sigma-70 family)
VNSRARQESTTASRPLGSAEAPGSDASDTEALLPQVYEELRRLAKQRLSREGPGLTLQPTALVHEAYMRILGDADVQWNSRGHFFAAAAQAMRRILIERARRVKSAKHGGTAGRRIDLDVVDELPGDQANAPAANREGAGGAGHEIDIGEQREQLVSLDAALHRLEHRDARKAQIVLLRFFAGLSIEQTAAALDLSPATVKNEWRFARAWLHSDMDRTEHPAHGRDD